MPPELPLNQDPDSFDLAVIGAGAAGLATGIFAAEENPVLRIALLEGAQQIGAKILVSGGGRCNVTHHSATPDDFQGNPPIVRALLQEFSERDTVNWFQEMGVTLKQEPTGKLFPKSNRARTVVDALVARCESLGAEIRTDHRVESVHAENGGWRIEHSHGVLHARRVVIATGGLSLPKSGSDGFGLDLARQMGHEVTALWPALVPLVLEDSFPHASLSGTSHPATLTTRVAGKIRDRRRGSLLWTHFGMSGPLTMDASRFWVGAKRGERPVTLEISLLPDTNENRENEWFLQCARQDPKRLLVSLLSTRLPRKVAQTWCRLSGVAGNPPIGQLSRPDRQNLIRALLATELPVSHDRGWNYAEVTAGGVPLSEIDRKTMESRLHSGLHFVGEVLDCEGRIGGFNFQWAWSTGHQAGRAIGRLLNKPDSEPDSSPPGP
ncbi:MAG: NAD(P)/FAD-dependent oxidoreductase [Planctomycetota bacterium]|nr:NAD(P)/FAD-dependent oxidoreductase [Planctomycetota bacterium]